MLEAVSHNARVVLEEQLGYDDRQFMGRLGRFLNETKTEIRNMQQTRSAISGRITGWDDKNPEKVTSTLFLALGGVTDSIEFKNHFHHIDVSGLYHATSAEACGQLSNLLATRVAGLTIILAMVIPLFDIWTFPQNDYSMRTWVDRLMAKTGHAKGAGAGGGAELPHGGMPTTKQPGPAVVVRLEAAGPPAATPPRDGPRSGGGRCARVRRRTRPSGTCARRRRTRARPP